MFSRFCILILISFCTKAQKVELSGLVSDFRSEALPGVTITLSDSLEKRHSFTDEKGYFSFQTQPGTYVLEASFLGFEKQQITVEINHDSSSRFYTITLKEAVLELEEAIVNGMRPHARFEGSKTIISPAASVLMAQSDGFMLIKNLPGVFATEDGEVRLNGQNGVSIQVDGKTVYLSGIALINFLKRLSPGSIEEVQISPNPDASSDASAKGGIINIVLKRNHGRGLQLNSYVNYQQSKNYRSNWGANVLYSKANAGWGIDYSGGQSERLKTGSLSREVENGQNTMQNVRLLNQDKIHNLRVFSDFKIGKTISLDLSASRNFYSRSIPGSSASEFHSQSISPDSILNTRSFSTYKQFTYNGGIRGRYRNDKKQVVTVMAQWLSFTHKESFTLSAFMDNLGPIERDTLIGNFGDEITSGAFQSDFSTPLSKILDFQAGIKQSLLFVRNHAIYKNREDLVLAESIRYKYNESILSGYGRIAGKYKKWNFSGGIRVENTAVEGNTYSFSFGSDIDYDLNYIHFFPSADIGYKWTESQQLTFNYGHYVTRPNYRDLSPSGYIVDKYTMVTGNTTLRPEFTHSLSLTYTPSQTIRTSINYSINNGSIGQVFIIRENGGLLITSQNMASRKNWAARVDALGFGKSKHWKPTGGITLLLSENKWLETNGYRKSTQLSPLLNLNNSFVLGKSWNAELTAYYNGYLALGQLEIPAMWSVSGGIGRKIPSKNLTVRLFANDIFASLRERAVFSSASITGTSNIRYEETYIGISLVYSFIKGKQKDSNESLINKDNRINY